MAARERLSPASPGPPLSKKEFAAAAARIEEQLATAKANAAHFDDRIKEWDTLKEVLKDLPEKVRHPVMVPFGPLAFFDGYLEHTNEVLCQLSSEWFALRTVKKASAMADRRRARVESDRSDVAKEIHVFDQRRRIAMEGAGMNALSPSTTPVGEEVLVPGIPGATVRVDEEGYMDIREPFHEEASARHREPVREPVRKVVEAIEEPSTGSSMPKPSTRPAAQRPEPSGTTKRSGARESRPATGLDTLARLRELERLEEMEELDDLVAAAEKEGGPGSATCNELDMGLGSTSSSTSAAQGVMSPADLFDLMSRVDDACSGSAEHASAPKAVVPMQIAPVSQRQCEANENAAPSAVVLNTVDGSSESAAGAFSGAILERADTRRATSTVASEPSAGGIVTDSVGASSAEPRVGQAPKKVSKFKAERQGLR